MTAPAATRATCTPTTDSVSKSGGGNDEDAGERMSIEVSATTFPLPPPSPSKTKESAIAIAAAAAGGGDVQGDDKEEFSSNDGGKEGDGGSGTRGSGGGYNADCSSSDTSSLDKGQTSSSSSSSSSSDGGDGASEEVVPNTQMIDLRIDEQKGHHRHDATRMDPQLAAVATSTLDTTLLNGVEGGRTTTTHQTIKGNNNQHTNPVLGMGGVVDNVAVERLMREAVSAQMNYDGRSTGAAPDGGNNDSDTQVYDDRQHQYNDGDGESTIQDPKACLPQWSGIRIHHPMDPRIDLSTVGNVLASQLTTNQPYPRNVNVPNPSLDDQHQHIHRTHYHHQYHHHHHHHRPSTLFANAVGDPSSPSSSHHKQPNQQYPFHNSTIASQPLVGLQGGPLNDNDEPPPLPSMEQYMKLMESVRPFFCAHGLATSQHHHHHHQQLHHNEYEDQRAQSEEQSSEPSSSELPTGSSDSDQKLPPVDLLADFRQPPPKLEGPMDWSNIANFPPWEKQHPTVAVDPSTMSSNPLSLLSGGNSATAADDAAAAAAAGGMFGPEADAKNGSSAGTQQQEAAVDDGGVGSDTASMAVLARVKRKHKRSGEDDGVDGPDNQNGGSTSNSNSNSAEWNTSNSGGSAASSSGQRRVRIQHPPVHHGQDNNDVNQNNDNMAVDVNRDWNENSDEQEGHVLVDVEHQQQLQQQLARHQGYGDDGGGDPQESATSTSSSDSGSGGRSNNDDNHQVPQAAPVHYGVPAVVSEYSSSRTGSSGASNNNHMSTSGSGSGGNTGSGTGSGTASGSNQGGSSGSGNDQGGISSNGNGSSGSGNDVKGSSEENMDNSGENNSGENSGGNSDASNRPSVKVGQKVAFEAQDPSNAHRGPLYPPEHHHHHYHNQSLSREPPQQNAHSENQADDEAVREKKIQDKKRKRMNMRRLFEEKVEQEMESSEASQAGEVLIRPGKPITLDKVLSFTKTPRLVVKADPPFLVVYTNAAYCRLCGIDSHKVVGKPIASLLAIPDQYDLSQLGIDKEDRPLTNSMEVPPAPESDKMSAATLNREVDTSTLPSADNLVAAEAAAGRARAATTKDDNTGMGLERLVTASGFSRLHVIKVRSQPHHMVGRNVKILKAKHPVKRSQEDGSHGSSISSLYDGPYHFAACSMSISPVVSSPEVYNAAVVTDSGKADSHSHKHKRNIEQEHADQHQHKSKRRKHSHHHNHQYGDHFPHSHDLERTNAAPNEPPLSQRKRRLVSHYVIQLEPFDGHSLKFGGLESQSSASTAGDAEFNGQLISEKLLYERITPSAAGGGGGENQNGMDNPRDSDDDEVDSEMSESQKHVSAIA